MAIKHQHKAVPPNAGQQRGVVVLEFLILFPLIIGLVYAAAVYGVLFSWQVRMQIAVDRASAAALWVERSTDHSTPVDGAVALANLAMTGAAGPGGAPAVGHLPEFLGGIATPACAPHGELIRCALKVELETGGCEGVPGAMAVQEGPRQLGFFGGFPPMPGCLSAAATVSI
ncbi:TadE/TadG family type IV pilus assembly protein [Isoalcanivorax beigongshangi]|uniref:TadE/TadG family type IV pilus assembly protein n=1 Tax=Isoalcanivorax beigongshangi TaxID=3238810 RepID=A0ABV4ACK1_9GAMM